MPEKNAIARKTLVVIPTYNEIDNIGKLIDELLSSFSDTLHVLIVDDNSPDGTADHVRKKMMRQERLHMIGRPGKMGLGTAYIEGFRYGLEKGYERIIEMDADYSHDPAMIKDMLEKAETADLVIGSRYIGNVVNVVNWPLNRLILSKAASYYTRMITGMPVADPTGGYKCFRSDVLRTLDLSRVRSQGYSFQIEMNYRVWKKGFSIVEFPIVFTDRTVGQSKMSRKNIIEAVWRVWWLRIMSLLRLL